MSFYIKGEVISRLVANVVAAKRAALVLFTLEADTKIGEIVCLVLAWKPSCAAKERKIIGIYTFFEALL